MFEPPSNSLPLSVSVSISVTFYLIFVQIMFSSVYVAEVVPFGKELLTRLTICCLYILTICNSCYFLFWFWGRDLGSDRTVPGHCLLVTYILINKNRLKFSLKPIVQK